MDEPRQGTPSGSLSGFWERGRRLLRILGQEWDHRVQPVMIVADSREPGGLPQSYRRFALTFAGARAANSHLKLRCDAIDGVVIDGICWNQSTSASTGPVLRLMSAATVISDAGAYNPVQNTITNFAGGWCDTPGDGYLPFSSGTAGGITNVGLQVHALQYNGNKGDGMMNLGIFLPFGSAMNFACGTNATALETITLTGYAR